MPSSIKLTPQVEEAIKIHGEEAFPNECCGFPFWQ